jgi:hypothetical protein
MASTGSVESKKTHAWELENLSLREIAFKAFRNWQATMQYQKTHHINHVKKLLRHKRLTLMDIYINLEQAPQTEERRI